MLMVCHLSGYLRGRGAGGRRVPQPAVIRDAPPHGNPRAVKGCVVLLGVWLSLLILGLGAIACAFCFRPVASVLPEARG